MNEPSKPAGRLARLLPILIARLKSPSTVYLAASILSRLGSLVLVPLYVRRLSSAEYGEYALSQSLLIIGPPIFALGLNNAFTKFQFEPSEQSSAGKTGAVGRLTALVTFVMAALVMAIVFAVHPRGIGLRGTWGLCCTIIAIAGSALHTIPVAYFRNEQRPYPASFLQLFELFSVAAFGWLFVGHFHHGLNGALEGAAATYAACGIIALVIVFRMPTQPLRRTLVREALRFSAPLIPHYLAVWLQGSADRWVLGFAGREAQLGPYSFASQVTSPTIMIMTAWNNERSARTGDAFRSEGARGLARQLPGIVKGYLIAVVIASACVAVVLPLVPFIAPALSSEALLYVGPLLVVGGIDWLYCPYQHVAYYSGHSKEIAVVTTVSAIANIGLSILAVPWLGVWGAILARGGATILKTIGMWWVASRILRAATDDSVPKAPEITAEISP